MLRKYLLGLAVFLVAFAVLSVSVLKSSSVAYVFATPTPPGLLADKSVPEIDYSIPYIGRILPDSTLWVFKAMRDRVWYLFTTNPLKRAELALLFSDKRLISSRTLFENRKPDIGVTTLTKGEKYLEIAAKQEEIARKRGMDTSSFLTKLAIASLKHRQIIEEDILPLAPEDAKPQIVKIEDYAKNTYKSSRDALNSKGIAPPKDPFDSQ